MFVALTLDFQTSEWQNQPTNGRPLQRVLVRHAFRLMREAAWQS
jgi:hypothetical protein